MVHFQLLPIGYMICFTRVAHIGFDRTMAYIVTTVIG